MSEDPDREKLRERLATRLCGFSQGIGLSVPDAREIIERAIADDPWAAPTGLEDLLFLS